MTWLITIPDWHPTRLNELLTLHWAQAARRKADDAQMISVYGRMAGVSAAATRRRVRLEVHGWPRGRMCDPDAFFKSLLDGLVKASFLVDDSQKWCECPPAVLVRSKEKKTIITLEDIEC